MSVHNQLCIVAGALATLSIGGCEKTATEPELPAIVIGIPPGWQGTVGTSALYEIGLYRPNSHGGRSAGYIDGPPLFTPEAGLLSQIIRADEYRGKRVRLSAWVRGHGLIAPLAGIWMRVDGPGIVTGVDNMANRTESGTTDWHQISVVLDVPTNAIGIVIGALLQGGGTPGAGTLFFDDMTLEVVGTDVPSTNMLPGPVPSSIDSAATVAKYLNAPASPANLDFERVP